MKIWQTLSDSKKGVIDILLENRGVKSKTFFNPINPEEIKLGELEIDKKEVAKAVRRIKSAKTNKESIIVYGDYDADGITATAILWEALYKLGCDVMPYIPNRFDEGYGIKAESVEKLKTDNPNLGLIVTVDNGIVASSEIRKISKLGIDVIVTDHHTKERKVPKAFAIIHTTKICGSAVSWILARELGKSDGLELASIGTIADQMPLVEENRSFAKYGLAKLNNTKRVGLRQLIKEAGFRNENIGTYEINYVIAPRINAMGRLEDGMDALRLLCTKDLKRARQLSKLVSETNIKRQEIVDKTILHASKSARNCEGSLIFISHESYHEGIIGLAAGKLVEEFYRPAIVVSRGKKISKGSARSVVGFNIIEAIREHSDFLIAYGGHVMAAGFTIETAKLEKFQDKLSRSAQKLLTDEILTRRLKVDCEIDFKLITWDLANKLKQFEPSGIGNPTPTFVTKKVEVVDVRFLGKDKTHLKLKLKKDNKFFDAIGFGMAKDFVRLKRGDLIDVVYSIEENVWNGTKSLQLKIRDLRMLGAENSDI